MGDPPETGSNNPLNPILVLLIKTVHNSIGETTLCHSQTVNIIPKLLATTHCYSIRCLGQNGLNLPFGARINRNWLKQLTDTQSCIYSQDSPRLDGDDNFFETLELTNTKHYPKNAIVIHSCVCNKNGFDLVWVEESPKLVVTTHRCPFLCLQSNSPRLDRSYNFWQLPNTVRYPKIACNTHCYTFQCLGLKRTKCTF